MKKGLTTVFILSTLLISAQDKGEYAKLKKLYNNEKYEDCAYKASLMSEDEKYKKDGEPFLFYSMCFYQISMDETLTPMYPKAYDDAFKAAATSIRKDKEGILYKEYLDYYTELKTAGIEDALVFIHENDFKKSITPLKKVYRLNEEDYALLFTINVFELIYKNDVNAQKDIKTAVDSLKIKLKSGIYHKEALTEEIFTLALVQYSEYLIKEEEGLIAEIEEEKSLNNDPALLEELNNELILMTDSAKKTIVFGQSLLPENPIIKSQTDKFSN